MFLSRLAASHVVVHTDDNLPVRTVVDRHSEVFVNVASGYGEGCFLPVPKVNKRGDKTQILSPSELGRELGPVLGDALVQCLGEQYKYLRSSYVFYLAMEFVLFVKSKKLLKRISFPARKRRRIGRSHLAKRISLRSSYAFYLWNWCCS
jgi:hypothetical protein